jgi:hypothetical protein
VLANELMAKEPLGRRRIRYVGVVPDGVAEVVISGGGRSEAFRPLANLWFAELPRAVARRATFVWLDEGGCVMGRFGMP